jgi:hypothetical protein
MIGSLMQTRSVCGKAIFLATDYRMVKALHSMPGMGLVAQAVFGWISRLPDVWIRTE